MSDSIVKLPWSFEIVPLVVAMHQVIRDVGWSDNNQIALSCHPDDDHLPLKEVAHGAATLPSRVDGEIVREDSWYEYFIPGFEGTYFQHVWKVMNEKTVGMGVCRMRLMKLDYKDALSFHEDFYVRYHIPIITNPAAFFFMNDSNEFPLEVDDFRVPSLNAYHLPADGSAFKVDTTRHHFVYNGGKASRIHLVCSRI